MSDTIYTILDPAMREDIVDFGNYVFSQAHEPHDFKKLLPKTYADHVPLTVKHFGALRDGKIRAMVAVRPLEMHILDQTLRIGFVGTVSVHPYARGEGHMKKLMAMMLDDSRKEGYDLLMLGGQRQRYNYFGFEKAGVQLRYTVTATNLRHAAADLDVSGMSFSELTEDRPDEVDFARNLAMKQKVVEARPRAEFLDIMHSWNRRCRLVRENGEMVGYVMGSGMEIGLTDEGLLLKTLKKMFEEDGLKEVEIAAAPYEKERRGILAGIAEDCEISAIEMINVMNWEKTLDVLMKLKASYTKLEDGCRVVEIDGEKIEIEVKDGQPRVGKTDDAAEMKLTNMEAQRMFFAAENLLAETELKNWTPLPLYISHADTF